MVFNILVEWAVSWECKSLAKKANCPFQGSDSGSYVPARDEHSYRQNG